MKAWLFPGLFEYEGNDQYRYIIRGSNFNTGGRAFTKQEPGILITGGEMNIQALNT